MKKAVRSRKALVLSAQLVVGLVALVILLLSQLGAFAGQNNIVPTKSVGPSDLSPTILEAPKPSPTQTVTEQTPIADNPESLIPGGVTPAQKICEDQMRSSNEAVNAVLSQAWALWDQMLALENLAAATSDPAEAANIFAQAESLRAEHIRLNNLGLQMQAERFGGHSGMGCGPNGAYFY